MGCEVHLLKHRYPCFYNFGNRCYTEVENRGCQSSLIIVYINFMHNDKNSKYEKSLRNCGDLSEED